MFYRKLRLSKQQLKNLDLIVDHMHSGKYKEASRLIDRSSLSHHPFEPLHETILRRTLELLIDPKSKRKRILPPDMTESEMTKRPNQLKLEEIMLTRMGMTAQSLDNIFEDIVKDNSEKLLLFIRYERVITLSFLLNMQLFHQHCTRAKMTADQIASMEPTEGISFDMGARYAVIIVLVMILAAIFFEDFEMHEPIS